jgi:predicted 2-oxoglutarate/Fe(II)-dependent dioxygenase YbiX/peroxiredoxin
MSERPQTFVQLLPGDPAPWFVQRSPGKPQFAFDTAAGRYIVLCFFASAGDPAAKAALKAVGAHRRLFDDERLSFFGVSMDARDEQEGRVREHLPGLRLFWDFDGAIGRRYGVIPTDAVLDGKPLPTRRFWLVLDPALRVMRLFPLTPDGSERAALFEFLKALPPLDRFAGFPVPAPVLAIPNAFEPAFCRKLIDYYEAKGGIESGFMQEQDGKTVMRLDPEQKRRRDCDIEDADLVRETQARVTRRILPELRKVHQFKTTRMERYLLSCYLAEDRGHFRAHRDNTTKGTAHRRFAISLNLNEDFEGGELSFPEYGGQAFKMPAGCAVVFSCSLLHRVSPVTRGRRYAFLPFLYDDEAARLRLDNNPHLGEQVSAYRDPEIEKA